MKHGAQAWTVGWLLALAMAASAAHAEVYRCVGDGKTVEFTDAPCGHQRSGSVVDIRPNSLDMSAGRESALKAENRRLRERLDAMEAGTVTPSASPARAAALDGGACQAAQRNVDIAASANDGNELLVQTRQSAMYAACGLPEPDRLVTRIGYADGGYLPYRVRRPHRPGLDVDPPRVDAPKPSFRTAPPSRPPSVSSTLPPSAPTTFQR